MGFLLLAQRSDCLRILLLCASPFNRFTLFLSGGEKQSLGLLASKKLPISAAPILFRTFSLGGSPLEVACEESLKLGGLSEFGVS